MPLRSSVPQPEMELVELHRNGAGFPFLGDEEVKGWKLEMQLTFFARLGGSVGGTAVLVSGRWSPSRRLYVSVKRAQR